MFIILIIRSMVVIFPCYQGQDSVNVLQLLFNICHLEKILFSSASIRCWPHLVFHPVKPRPDGHWLDLSPPVHALVVGAGLAQGLVQSSLELLDPHHHIEMSLGVLLYHVPHVVRFSGLQVTSQSSILSVTQTCWNFRLATKYLIFRINLTAFLCANVKLEKSTLK